MANIQEITTAEFQAEVLDSDIPVIVDFSAVWCQPCKRLEPIVDELAGEWAGKVKFVKVDVDTNPEIGGQFGVMGVPTLLMIKGGEAKDRLVGLQNKQKIVGTFSPHF